MNDRVFHFTGYGADVSVSLSQLGVDAYNDTLLQLCALAAYDMVNHTDCICLSLNLMASAIKRKWKIMFVMRISRLIIMTIESRSSGGIEQAKKVTVHADDDSLTTRRIKRYFEQTDRYTVISQTNSRKVVDTIKDSNPDLVLLDLWMSGLGGEEIN
ncbi:MAG: PleD family two-component response regulator [Pseudohongiellaceae bacterium]|jgi:PleD family two-component response regulator